MQSLRRWKKCDVRVGLLALPLLLDARRFRTNRTMNAGQEIRPVMKLITV